MENYYSLLKNDIRFIEGLKACYNCGACTAICPAAAFYPYDPRQIADTVQRGDAMEIEALLKSNTIWYCGECLSCKTRCPGGNTPGYIIQTLRALSIESGLFIHSKQGQKQLAIKQTVGEHILKYGYCVYIDEINTDMYPEQGPVWNWLKKNKEELLEKLGTSYKKSDSGTLRDIPESSLGDLRRIFDETGATKRFEKLEKFSEQKAKELGLDKQEYFDYLYNENTENENE
jgi:heterodisulfide reductase subunit C